MKQWKGCWSATGLAFKENETGIFFHRIIEQILTREIRRGPETGKPSQGTGN